MPGLRLVTYLHLMVVLGTHCSISGAKSKKTTQGCIRLTN